MLARNVLFLPEAEFTVLSVCESTRSVIALGGATPSSLRLRLTRTTHRHPVVPTLSNKTLRHPPTSPFLPTHPSIMHHSVAVPSCRMPCNQSGGSSPHTEDISVWDAYSERANC